jgi:hypothetical protein
MPLLNEDKNEAEKIFTLKWYKARNFVKENFGQRPDINAMLYIIGMNEVGIIKEVWEKEEKQDLMHVAVCKLLSNDGYYKLISIDNEGWPHYELNTDMPKINLREQEDMLKRKIVAYFEEAELI